MRKFVLKAQVRDDVDLSRLEGETLEFEIVDQPGFPSRLGVEGAWELPKDEARTFVFIGEQVTQQVANVHAVPGDAGYAISSSQPGERKPGLKATPVSQKDADRMRHILHNYDLLLSLATKGIWLAEAVKNDPYRVIELSEALLEEYKRK